MRVPKSLVFLTILLLVLSCKKEEPVPAAAKAAVPTTEVTVTITGLCSFADRAKPDGASVTPLTLYVMNAGQKNHSHIPLLMYDRAHKTGPVLEQTPRPTIAQGEFDYIHLVGEELMFRDEHPEDLKYEDTPVGCDTWPESKSLQWLPRLRDIMPEHPNAPVGLAQLDNRYLAGLPSPNRIAAYFHISHGALEAHAGSSPIVWEFKTSKSSSDGKLKQAIAQKVTWKFTIDGEFLTIDSRKLIAGKVQNPLLKLKAVDGKIDLTIANVVASDIDVLAETAMGNAKEVDPHFEYYYDFITVKPPIKRIPVAYGMCLARKLEPGTSERIRCLMKEFVELDPQPVCTATNDKPPPATIGGLNCVPDRIP